jgi:hypothetical protein
MLRTALGLLLALNVLTLMVLGIDVRMLLPGDQMRQVAGDWLAFLGTNATGLLVQVVPR